MTSGVITSLLGLYSFSVLSDCFTCKSSVSPSSPGLHEPVKSFRSDVGCSGGDSFCTLAHLWTLICSQPPGHQRLPERESSSGRAGWSLIRDCPPPPPCPALQGKGHSSFLAGKRGPKPLTHPGDTVFSPGAENTQSRLLIAIVSWH